MRVLVRLPAALRAPSDSHPFAAELAEDATVADVFDVLRAERPAAERRIRDEQGVLRPHVNVFLADENIRRLDGLATPLADHAELTVIAAISGG